MLYLCCCDAFRGVLAGFIGRNDSRFVFEAYPCYRWQFFEFFLILKELYDIYIHPLGSPRWRYRDLCIESSHGFPKRKPGCKQS